MKFFPLLLLLFPEVVSAQTGLPGSRNGFLGASGHSRNLHDAFALLANPAAVAQTKAMKAAIYSEKRFMIKELSVVTGAVTFPFRAAGYGVQLSRAGNRDFSETFISIGTGRRVSNLLSLGIQFNYKRFRQVYYGGGGAASGTIGAIFMITENLRIGSCIAHFIRLKSNEFLSPVHNLAIGYQVADGFYLWGGLTKENDRPASMSAGIFYRFTSQFLVKMMFSTVHGEFSASTAFSLKRYSFEVFVFHHQQLGITPGLMISFHFQNKKEGE